MKIKIVTLFCLAFSISINAQRFYQKGKLFLKSGDTIECEINPFSQNVMLNDKKIDYKIGDEKKEILNSEVESLMLDSIKYERISFAYYENVEPVNYLAVVVVRGNSSLYKQYIYYSSQYGASIGYDYFIKANNKFYKIDKLGFKKSIKQVYENCEEIVKSIDDKQFKYDQIIELVEFANSKCYE